MSDQYLISVVNMSGRPVIYTAFQALPNIEGNPPVFITAYTTSIPEPKQIITTFPFSTLVYGVCGMTTVALGTHVYVQDTSGETIQLATADTKGTSLYCTIDEDGLPYFDPSQTRPPGATVPGSFQIITDENVISADRNFPFIGVGKQNGADFSTTIPTAVIPAQGGRVYTIYPQAKFLICAAAYPEGEIVNLADVGPVLLVDFSSGPGSQRFSYTVEGTFVPFEASDEKLKGISRDLNPSISY